MISDRDRSEMMRRLRLGNLRKLLRARCGPTLPDDDAGREYLYELLLPISVGANADIKMTNVIEVWAPWMQQQEATELVDDINRTPRQQRMPTARQLGKRLRVINGEREWLKLWTIAASDLTAQQVLAWRRAKAKTRVRRLRQRRGSKPRAEYEAQSKSKTKPWNKEGISRAQWYRRSKAPTNGGGADQQECRNDDIKGRRAIHQIAELQTGRARKAGLVAVRPVPRRRNRSGY